MPVLFYVPPMLLLGSAIAALLVYAVLRWVIWSPGAGTSPQSVSEHGLWVGVIGWLASSLQGAMTLGIIPANPSAAVAVVSAESIVPALAWPVLGCLTVHALGQVSYPGPRRMRREAVLSVRRIKDFLPRRLALTTAAIFLSAAAAIARVATLPGFAAVPPTTVSDGQYNYLNGGGDGRIPGPEAAAWLGGALLVLAVGTWLVLWLIARRRQLESLDAADNAVLRSIAMNRLLRTASTVAAGLAVIAGNFASRPDPAEGPTSWTNFSGLAATVVPLVMWWWRPPRLAAAGLGARNRPESGVATGHQHPAARLVSSLGALLGLAAGLPLVAGTFLSQFLPTAASYGFAGFVALTAASVLLVIAAGEFLLQRNYGTPAAPRGWPRQPVSPALLTTAVLALFVFLAVLGVAAVGQARLAEGPGWVPAGLLTAGACAASLPAFLMARFREGVRDAPRGLDAALRAITLHRVVRTLAATLTAQAGVLLLTQSNAWAAVLGRATFGETDPAAGAWWPATLAGSVLGAAAIVIAVTPVRTLARTRSAPAPRPDKEPAT
ncbi:hypothetical protein SAMN04487916_101245 [Arthrobacter sp. ov407]|uniref:hypothetical protein n=1 Tax=Arthrobacter sp. ov407 TaxID=1761748 RepID=UPI00088F01BD|nr:hypothetical protein [Arthrobacter sp. ov407]SDK48550.1 hypothetical protein SAMN04487916_101245 [Arthrobacter sp. ov407]